MANIKSAKKRILVNRKKALRNKMVKSGVNAAVRKLNDQVAAGDQAAAQAALKNAVATISKAASKGVVHKKTASRKVSRMTKMVNKMA